MALARVTRAANLFRNAIQPFFSSRDLHNGRNGGDRVPDNGSPAVLRLLLLGSPGAGKGTQSARITKTFPFVAISSGDILRKNIQSGNDVGRLAQRLMAKGEMVPDQVMVELIGSELASVPHSQHWLLDGFPRTVAQAEALDDQLDHVCQPLSLVVNLHVPTDIILERIMDRWVHIPSGRVYNDNYNPPKITGFDDVTGEKLVRRPDDDPDVFRIRMEKHLALTEPLLEYYDKRSILLNLSGKTSDEIYPQIEAEIMKHVQTPAAPHRAGEQLVDERRSFREPVTRVGPLPVADAVPVAVPVIQLA